VTSQSISAHSAGASAVSPAYSTRSRWQG